VELHVLPAGALNMARAWTAGSALSYPADKTIRTGPNDGLLLLAGGSAKADASSPVKSAGYAFATIRTDKGRLRAGNDGDDHR
jgi:hypothetical protein